MKEFDLTNSEALDAGWDADEEKGPAVSVTQPKTALSTEIVADEFDAGWDLTPLDAPVSSAIVDGPALVAPRSPQQLQNGGVQSRARTEKKPLQATPRAIDSTSAHARPLTKKERRDIERQQRLHAAHKQTQAKSEKKRQRKQVAITERVPVAQAPRAAAPSSMNGAAQQRRKAKPRAEQRRQQSADAKPQAQRTATSESRRPKPNPAQALTATIDSTSQAIQKKSQLPMYFAIGLVLLSLALLWHFAGRR